MRNSSKINTLESKFPILAIEQDCLLTKEADISVGFEVQLPELFTISGEDYEILHSLWHKAIKVLPQYTVSTNRTGLSRNNTNLNYKVRT